MGGCLGLRVLIIVISLFFGICHLAFPLNHQVKAETVVLDWIGWPPFGPVATPSPGQIPIFHSLRHSTMG